MATFAKTTVLHGPNGPTWFRPGDEAPTWVADIADTLDPTIFTTAPSDKASDGAGHGEDVEDKGEESKSESAGEVEAVTASKEADADVKKPDGGRGRKSTTTKAASKQASK